MYARFGKERLETASKVSEGIKRANLLLSLRIWYNHYMCGNMCGLNSPQHSVSTWIEIDSDCRFALVARNLVDRKAREAPKTYN